MSPTKFVFSGRSEKQDGRPGLWLAETFSTSPLKPLNGIQRKLTESKISTSSTKFVFLRANQKNKMAALSYDWLRHFRLLLWERWTEFNKTWQEARSQLPLPSLCFSGRSENKMAALASDWLRHFRLLLWNHRMEFNETWQEARSQRPLPSCFLSSFVKFRSVVSAEKSKMSQQIRGQGGHLVFPIGPKKTKTW